MQQLKAIEINSYAFELAQVAVQIGYLQWRRDNGFQNDEEPVLQVLDGFENKDALVKEIFRKVPKDLREARAEEHIAVAPLGSDQPEIAAASDELRDIAATRKRKASGEVRVYHERAWPDADVIVSNPPFLGDKFMRRELGDEYVESLREIYGDRLPGQSDLCCYWFEKAREQIGDNKCNRSGLLATQNIRGGASRAVLDRIKKSGDIFFAVSDRDWILDGANVHVSMIGFDDGSETRRTLDGNSVAKINANLTSLCDITQARRLSENANIGFIGNCKGGPFDLAERESDVMRPVMNSEDVYGREEPRWIIDNADETLNAAALYEAPHRIVVARVKPKRDKNRDKWLRENWWRPQRMRAEMRQSIAPLNRFIVTATTSKHRIFLWLFPPTLPDHKLVVFARDDDYFFGVLHSRYHQAWAQGIGTQLRERESGLNYNVQSSFETFPFPESTTKQKFEISIAAKELNELRENWLNPSEWTMTKMLEFPGATDGPWSRFIVDPDARAIGTVRYPRVEARDDDCAKKLAKRTLTNLYNERPAWLANAHAKLDAAVAQAYGFPVDLTDEQILERLLALNQQRAADEKPATKKQLRVSRAKTEEEFV